MSNLRTHFQSIERQRLTQNQKNEASSKAFCRNQNAHMLYYKTKTKIHLWLIEVSKILQTWNWMKWIRDKSNSGFLNQKSSSRGLSFTPEAYSVIPAFSNAKVAITCCNFAPTKRTSCLKRKKDANQNATEKWYKTQFLKKRKKEKHDN